MPLPAYANDSGVEESAAETDAGLAAADVTNPVFDSISVSPKIATAGDAVTVTVRAHDEEGGSGLSSGWVVYQRPQKGTETVYVYKNQDGTLSGTLRIDEGTQPGEWLVNRVYTRDAAGNGYDTYSEESAYGSAKADLSAGSFTVKADGSSDDETNPDQDPSDTQVVRVPFAQQLTFTGSEQTGVAAGDGYTVSGGAATNAGSYTATLSLTDKEKSVWNTTGSSDDVTVQWSIARLSVSTPSLQTLSYNGKEQTVVSDGDWYTVKKGGSATDPGSYTATLSLRDKDNTFWSSTGKSDDLDLPWSISESDYTWCIDDGSHDLSINLDTDEGVTWSLSDPSVAALTNQTATVISWGSYKKQVAGVTFVPEKAGFTELYASVGGSIVSTTSIRVTPSKYIDLSGATVTGVNESYTYSASPIEPQPTVVLDGKTLVRGTDYTVSYQGNKNAGTATMTIVGAGEYSGTITRTFVIAKADPAYSAPTLNATVGQKLGDLALPFGYSWQDSPQTSVGEVGDKVFKATYTPSDTANYNVVKDISITVHVTAPAPDPQPTPDPDPEPTPDPDPTPDPEPAPARFVDVDYDAWYAQGVEFCAGKGLITGYGNGYFGVGDPLTRAQLVAILWRNAEPEAAEAYDSNAANETGMADVEDNAWYTGAANWAVANEVINGFGGTEFRPNDVVTTEQLVAIIGNYVDPKASETADQGILSSFVDQDAISDWARGSVAWGKQAGIINGYEEDGARVLKPYEAISRERVAVILMNAFEAGIIS